MRCERAAKQSVLFVINYPRPLKSALKHRKYARRYLGEAAYRFNRRFHLRELVPRLLRAMILCGPCAEPALRQASNFLS